jgi:CSLREA domain-containing protein
MSKHYAVFRFLAVAVCALWFVGSQAQATTFTVSKLADTNDGTCNIDCSLREAIAAANDIAGNDVISFDTTIFNTAKTISLSSGFTLVEDVTINGPTVGISIVGKGNASIIFIVNQGVSAKFTRLTLLTSYSGIINYGTTIGTDCVMSGNSYGAKNRGTLTFINSTFTNNSDGIENEGTVILRGCTLEGNRFTAIENYGTLSCSNSSLSRNNAASNISAVYNGGPANFTNCTISNNEYGLYNMVDFSKAAFTITNCTMSGNKIGLFNQGMATLSNSLVVGNVENISGSFTDGGVISRRERQHRRVWKLAMASTLWCLKTMEA